MEKERKIISVKSTDLKNLESDYDVIVINTSFNKEEINNHSVISNDKEILKRIDETNFLIRKASSLLKEGGLIFVYGLPKFLPLFGKYMNFLKLDSYKLYFKYWISAEFDFKNNNSFNSHLGILMYLKTKIGKYNTPFHLNTKTVRVPYGDCKACKKNLKDWGGKKHLMNPLGSAFSDVWQDKIQSDDYTKIPPIVINRIYDLTEKNAFKFLLVEQTEKFLNNKIEQTEIKNIQINVDEKDVNKVILRDSIEVMEEYSKKYPGGLFDMAFADPPYNLGKNYSKYDDEKRSYDYVKWCNKWINGMYNVLKPGGALLLLNIPKWAIFHAEFLLNKAEFRNWIVWDALSSPAGKIMPAHYSLLYFTKPGGKAKFNDLGKISARHYCNRISCRKNRGEEDKEKLTEIWRDVFRIKHKKDRDKHPCQLPIKLMERIIDMTTNEGDVVYDPFGGAGTTAIAAKLKNRKYVISDLDENYVKIAQKNLNLIKLNSNGDYHYVREKSNNTSYFKRNGITRKEVEKGYMSLCQELNRIVEFEELQKISPVLHNKIDSNNNDFQRLKKIARRMMEARSTANNFNQKVF